jgi:hypothetical protein
MLCDRGIIGLVAALLRRMRDVGRVCRGVTRVFVSDGCGGGQRRD